jgi:amidase
MSSTFREEPVMKDPVSHQISRRRVVQYGAAGLAASAAGRATVLARSGSDSAKGHLTSFRASAPYSELEEMTVAEMRAAIDAGDLTSRDLVDMYIARIEALDQGGPSLKSVLQLNPDARAIAAERDEELAGGTSRGPLHGIPVLLKDNIDTADSLYTTAGSLALMGSTPAEDATVAAQLRDAGAVILGKTNLTEWANFRANQASSGWSGRGGQTLNPYALDRTPSGSSSGSAVAVAANLTAIALGTETNGSIVSPASVNGVVGIKPTVGLTSRAGVIPIAASQDSVGILSRTVEDAAIALGVLTGVDDRDPATSASEGQSHTDYTQFLDENGLQGVRLGVPRDANFTGYSPETDQIFEQTLDALRALGAEVVDPADIPTVEDLNATPGSFDRLKFEFKRDLNAYLEERQDPEIGSLADLIAFNEEHRDEEMVFFQQEVFEASEAFGEDDQAAYEELSERLTRQSGPEGIDAVLAEHDLDALIAPSFSPATMIDLVHGEQFLGASSGIAAMAGYPVISVPMGFAFGLPVGLTFMGTAYSEPTLLKLAHAFEQATLVRRPPTFRPNSVALNGSMLGIEGPTVPGTATPEASPDTEGGTPEATPGM